MKMKRRDAIAAGLVGAAGTYAALRQSPASSRQGKQKSAVVALKAPSYDADLSDILYRGIRECGLDVRGKRILLKPNLVEFDSRTAINTDARLIVAALDVFRRMGAADVKIGEGPGHRRDTYGLADEAAYERTIPNFHSLFTDLNRDDVAGVRNCFKSREFFFPVAVLQADLIVSLAKMKTHHWAGATLTMKNFFGTVPGAVYGWPKNHLHHFGVEDAIVELNRLFAAKSFGIVDGIVGMEGNGPIQGTPKLVQTVVLGSDLVAVDATCCRIMGIDPSKMGYISSAQQGNSDESCIVQRGEKVADLTNPFALLPAFQHLRLSASG